MNEIFSGAIPDAQRQLASLPIAVVLLAPGQLIATANPAAEQFLGQSERRLLGKHIRDALFFEELHLTERLADSESQVSARDVNAVIVGKGRVRLDVLATPIVNEQGWQLLTLNTSNASDTMGEDGALDEAGVLRAPEILAHEIKNPLAAIRGASQLLARKVGVDDRALTGLIAGEVDRVAKLIDQMQSLSQRTMAPVEACNLHEVVRRGISVVEAVQEQSSDQHVPISEEFDPSLPPVLGNADVLVQVLINLLSNAREACAKTATPQIVVRTRFASGLQLHSSRSRTPMRIPVEIRVSDNGPGVDPALREHLFEPFVTTKKNGQGLGLALVRKLIREMNGRIVHERDEVEGWTHFRINLPLANEMQSHISAEEQGA